MTVTQQQQQQWSFWGGSGVNLLPNFGSILRMIMPHIIPPRWYEEIYQLHHVMRISGASRAGSQVNPKMT